MGRSILAVVVGFIAWTILWLVSNFAIAGAFPDAFREDGGTASLGILLLLLADSATFSLLSGWLTGVVAKRRQVAHGVALGVLLLAVGLFFQISSWSLLPVWYHLVFLAMLLPMAALGGKLRQNARSGRP